MCKLCFLLQYMVYTGLHRFSWSCPSMRLACSAVDPGMYHTACWSAAALAAASGPALRIHHRAAADLHWGEPASTRVTSNLLVQNRFSVGFSSTARATPAPSRPPRRPAPGLWPRAPPGRPRSESADTWDILHHIELMHAISEYL